MAKKEFKYRGKSIEELQELSITQLAELLPSAIRRKVKRGFTEEQQTLLKKLEKKKTVKTHCRTMPILPAMINRTIKVYSGKEYVDVEIQPEMIGHVLGEYAQTRKKVAHSNPGVGATRSSSNLSVR